MASMVVEPEAARAVVAEPADWRTISTVFLAVATAMVATATRSNATARPIFTAFREAFLFLAGWLWGASAASSASSDPFLAIVTPLLKTLGMTTRNTNSDDAEAKGGGVRSLSTASFHGSSELRVAARLAKAVDFLENSAVNPGVMGWERFGSRRDVDVWYMVDPKTNIKHSRGVAIIEAPPDIVVAALEDDATKNIFDKQWRQSTIVKELSPEIMNGALSSSQMQTKSFVVRRDEYKGVFPAKARDCVVAYCRVNGSRVGRSEDSRLLCLASIEADDDRTAFAYEADDSAYVRMHVSAGGYLIEPCAEGSKVTSVVVLDPKGSVPRTVVNFVAFDRPMGLARLRDVPLLKQPYKWPPLLQTDDTTDNNTEIRDHVKKALTALLTIEKDPTTKGFAFDEAASTDRRTHYYASSFSLEETEDTSSITNKIYAAVKGPVDQSAAAIHGSLDENVSKIDKMRENSELLASYGDSGDSLLDDFELLKPISCYYYTYRPVMMTSPRDAVVAVLDAKSNKDGTYVRLTTSITHPSAPPETPKKVRMTVKLSGFVFRPNDDDKTTNATNVAIVDPNGGLAPRLQERIAKSRAKQLDIIETFF